MQTKHESLGLLYFLWSAQARPQVTSWRLDQAANLSCPTVSLELHQKSVPTGKRASWLCLAEYGAVSPGYFPILQMWALRPRHHSLRHQPGSCRAGIVKLEPAVS